MARLADWQNNLTDLIERKRETPFAFGTFDCSLWAMFAVQAVIGIEMHDDYYNTYKTGRSGLRRIRKVFGVKQPIDIFTKFLGERQAIAMAKKGDIVFTSNQDLDIELVQDLEVFGPVMGVCYGQQSIFVGETGLVFVDTLSLDGCLWVS